jgi:hypothetical protein
MNRIRVSSVIAQAFVAVVAWASTAGAHPGYPAVIDGALGEPSYFVENEFKPTACQLCHTSTAGGTALVAFGTLMVSTYGLSNDPINEDDNSLKQAMIGLQDDDSVAITDLKSGINPNSDPEVFATALPQPTYGCAIAPMTRGRPPFPGVLVAFAMAAAILVAIRQRIARAPERDAGHWG